ncbi:MAG: aspartyl protease family protein [Planctomycetota bacterium]|jgi:hypothetical protein|nr:aspartyl protease family protein [Planctomycetota bacterium]MDP6937263.1 aspartyl protease family protein [Planctomycetota bacterium]
MVLGLACVGGPTVKLEPSAATVMENMRVAFGWREFASHELGWVIHGTSHEQGLDGSFSQMLNPRGLFVSETRSELPSIQGFDGEVAWTVDHTGMPRRPALSSRSLLLGMAWVGGGAWLDPTNERFQVAVDAEHSDEETLALDVRLPGGGFHCTVIVDRLTWLRRKVVVHLPYGKRLIELLEYAAPEGFQVATKVRRTGISGEVSTHSIESVAPMPLFARDPYSPRVQRPADTRFLPEAPSELAKVRITASGHILVRPRIARQDGGWFLLDSGAAINCIDPEFADALGFEPFGVVSVVGTGGVEQASYRRGELYELGPMVVRGTPWLELDLDFLEPHLGVKLNGVLGHDTFARAGIEIDLDAGRVWVQNPETWIRPAVGTPLVLDQNVPCVECSFDGGHQGWFSFDTGSDDTVTFHGPAVERLDLIKNSRGLASVKIAGVGGIQRGKRGPLGWFEMCGERFEQLPVTFMSLAPGALNNATTLGNIGGGLVRGYRVSVDLPGGKLFLTPSE